MLYGLFKRTGADRFTEERTIYWELHILSRFPSPFKAPSCPINCFVRAVSRCHVSDTTLMTGVRTAGAVSGSDHICQHWKSPLNTPTICGGMPCSLRLLGSDQIEILMLAGSWYLMPTPDIFRLVETDPNQGNLSADKLNSNKTKLLTFVE